MQLSQSLSLFQTRHKQAEGYKKIYGQAKSSVERRKKKVVWRDPGKG